MIGIKKSKSPSAKTAIRNEIAFLFAILVIPVVQFCVFYIGVNFNSILMAFQKYDIQTNTFNFIGIGNFTRFFNSLKTETVMLTSIKNSAIQYAMTLLVGMPLNILVSYCIWRKIPCSGVFKIVIFLPSMVSSIVFVMIAKYLIEYGFPIILKKPDMNSLVYAYDTGFMTVIIYGLWIGAASGMVLYLGAMSRIDNEVIEYGQLEGVGALKEFICVVVPLIFSTVSTFIIVGVAAFFSGYGHFYSFFGNDAAESFYTLGYYIFVKVVKGATAAEYPYASAMGLVFTAIAVPVTLTAKYLLEKFGPSED